MTQKDAIAFLQSRVDLINCDFPGVLDYKAALETAIHAMEKIQDYEDAFTELITAKVGNYERHVWTHEYGYVIQVNDVMATFRKYLWRWKDDNRGSDQID